MKSLTSAFNTFCTQGLVIVTWEKTGKNQVNPGNPHVNPRYFSRLRALTRNLGFLEDEDLRILGKCIGDHWKPREPGIWNLGKTW